MSGMLPPIFTDPIPEPDVSLKPIRPILPEGEPEHRIPHLGHALLFISIVAFFLIAIESLVVLMHSHSAAQATELMHHPKVLVASEAATYLLTLTLSWLIFPLLWHRSFADGLSWNLAAARRFWPRLILLGLTLGWAVEAASSFLPMPGKMPIDDMFRTPSDVWLITIFGTLLGPLFEEICFRGFLLPAFAIAYDWLTLNRTPEAVAHWQRTTSLTTTSFVFSGILTSVLFALLHGEQIAYSWTGLSMLVIVSLVLTFIRVRTKSVAAPYLVHASYNLFVFIALFIATNGYRHLDKLQ